MKAKPCPGVPRILSIALCGAALVICIQDVLAAGPPSGLDVNVTNTSKNPVPVTGSVGVSGGVTVNNTASAPVPVVNVNPGAASLFNVPFFIEQVTASPVKTSLAVDFALAKPAILESVSLECVGYPLLNTFISVDGGPLGLNGVTGAGQDPDVGVVVGLIAGLKSPIELPLLQPFPGGLGGRLPPTPIGVPVNSALTFRVFQDTAKGTAACFGNLIFRSLS